MLHTDPIVKWSGSKRSQAEEIVKRFPNTIDTYHEPFCGGCSVMYRLLQTPSVEVGRYVAYDLNKDLIALWNAIRDRPEWLSIEYKSMWDEFNSNASKYWGECCSKRKRYFEEVRERFNKRHHPEDFLFIMRTTTNGMPRYNKDGNFNNSCHFTRPGIHPSKLDSILKRWSDILSEHDVQFKCQTYSALEAKDGDLTYLDPPYFNTSGMYYGGLDFDQYFNWLSSLRGKWVMSFDGRTNKEDFTYSVPEGLYKSHEYLTSGNSSFRRVIGNDKHAIVEESLYKNYDQVG